MKGLAALALFVAMLLAGAGAQAGLLADAAKLQKSWQDDGAKVSRLPAQFLFEGDVRAQELRLPPLGKDQCHRVTLLSARHVQFFVLATRQEKMSASDLQQAGASAEAGVLSIEDCGDGELSSGRLLVTIASPRGSIEVLVSQHKPGLSQVHEVLVARATGPRSRPPAATTPPLLAPLKERVARARQVARTEGARMVVPVNHRADRSGAGVIALRLSGGCHRIHVLAESPAGSPVDVDAEVYVGSLSAVVSRDRAHAADARLDFCVGKPQRVELRYAGAGGPRPVTVLAALWPAPLSLPNWGEQWQSGLLTALHRRHAPPLNGQPIKQALGPAGVNLVPITLEPRSCYLAAAALTRGQAGAMRLSVRNGPNVRYDDAVQTPLGSAVTFCTGADPQVLVMVDVRARIATWALALWHMTSLDP